VGRSECPKGLVGRLLRDIPICAQPAFPPGPQCIRLLVPGPVPAQPPVPPPVRRLTVTNPPKAVPAVPAGVHKRCERRTARRPGEG